MQIIFDTEVKTMTQMEQCTNQISNQQKCATRAKRVAPSAGKCVSFGWLSKKYDQIMASLMFFKLAVLLIGRRQARYMRWYFFNLHVSSSTVSVWSCDLHIWIQECSFSPAIAVWDHGRECWGTGTRHVTAARDRSCFVNIQTVKVSNHGWTRMKDFMAVVNY